MTIEFGFGRIGDGLDEGEGYQEVEDVLEFPLVVGASVEYQCFAVLIGIRGQDVGIILRIISSMSRKAELGPVKLLPRRS